MSLQLRARRAEVAGWVRNCEDGSVEAYLQGRVDRVDEVLEWMAQGPRGARVERVDVAETEEVVRSGHDFEVR